MTAKPSYPYDYCFDPKPEFIPPTSLQPTECSCYIQLRIQDKSKRTQSTSLMRTRKTANMTHAGMFNCSMFPDIADTTLEGITALNPWLEPDCDTELWKAFGPEGFIQLCILQGSPTTSTSTTAPAPTQTALEPPAPTQPGAAENCAEWHIVASGDGCWSISEQYGISLEDFYSWNPGVGSDCSTLWLDYAVCVGVVA